MHQILILDNNLEVLQSLREGLMHAFSVITTEDQQEALEFALQKTPSAILVDVHNREKFEFCKQLRLNVLTRHIPLMVMASRLEAEIVSEAIEMGIDDCLLKPIHLNDLELRLKARIRRLEEALPKRSRIGNMVLVSERNEIELEGKSCHLSPIEFQLLRVFILNPNRAISRPELIRAAWRSEKASNRTVDVHVSSLRRKLLKSEYKIYSIYGTGYILRQENDVETQTHNAWSETDP